MPYLLGAGGTVLGSMDVEGERFADSDDVRNRAMDDAARAGGTHLLVHDEDSDLAIDHHAGPHGVGYLQDKGAYVVVRVPAERWASLPPGLQPVPGRNYTPRVVAGPPDSP